MPKNIGGTVAKSAAEITTIGVYTRANLVMNSSLFALFAVELSTSARILDTVDSWKGFVTLILIFFNPYKKPKQPKIPYYNNYNNYNQYNGPYNNGQYNGQI